LLVNGVDIRDFVPIKMGQGAYTRCTLAEALAVPGSLHMKEISMVPEYLRAYYEQFLREAWKALQELKSNQTEA